MFEVYSFVVFFSGPIIWPSMNISTLGLMKVRPMMSEGGAGLQVEQALVE